MNPAPEAAAHLSASRPAVDASGRLYVADTFNSLLRRIAPDGTVTTLAGTGVRGLSDGAGTTATFRTPQALAWAANGRLVVADTGNHAVRIVGLMPALTAISPTQGTQGETVTLTLTGTDLVGATALTFQKDGTADPSLVATNLQATADGTELQTTLPLAPNTALVIGDVATYSTCNRGPGRFFAVKMKSSSRC